MSKFKIKIGVSYIFLIVFCLLYNQFLLLINYTLVLALHEMAHFYVARSKGYKVNKIKLDMLGMKLNISQNIDKNDHFWIALAGPMLNFVLCLLCCALWWIVPESYFFTATFFQANLILAVFNILPVEPLDGGVMLNCLLSKSSTKVAKVVSRLVNIVFIITFVVLFILSCDSEPNLILFLFALFFLVNLIKTSKKDEYDMFYKMLFKRNAPISKVNLLKVSPDTTLLDCFKQIKQNNYTIFYYPTNKPNYITENELNLFITHYDLKTKLKDITHLNK